MPLTSSISLTTRTSDLDSLRHVNNRIYEQLCAEGRFRLLEERGYAVEALLDKAISLRPVASFAKFWLQQKSGATLHIQTDAFPMGGGRIFWNHHVRQPDDKLVCHIQAMTETLEGRQTPIELLPPADESPAQILIETVPAFSGQCVRASSGYSAIYTDMDTFGDLPIAAYWRIFEEGRHMFGEQLGLTLDRFVEFDTHFFWVGGTYQFYRPIRAGQRVSIHTWLERIERIRVYIRQEITTADQAEVLGASREEHLVVSLQAARPKRVPPEMLAIVEAYLEQPAQP